MRLTDSNIIDADEDFLTAAGSSLSSNPSLFIEDHKSKTMDFTDVILFSFPRHMTTNRHTRCIIYYDRNRVSARLQCALSMFRTSDTLKSVMDRFLYMSSKEYKNALRELNEYCLYCFSKNDKDINNKPLSRYWECFRDYPDNMEPTACFMDFKEYIGRKTARYSPFPL